MLTLVLFNLTNGIILGLFYVLMALGLSLILNLSNVINFAHGNFLALGAYFAFTLQPYLGYWGAFVAAPLLVGALGLVIEQTMIKRLYARPHIYSLLLTFGLAFIIQDMCRLIWGVNGVPMAIPHALNSPLSNQFFFLTGFRIFLVAVVVVAVAALFAFLGFTRVGTRIRAGTFDLDTVSALGINIGLLRAFNFALGIGLAGLAGVLAAGQIGINPNMGDDLVLPSFIAIIVGGIGSLTGTLVGGLVIGMASAVTSIWWSSGSEVIIYILMVVILVARPRGIMGEEGMMT